MSATNFLDNLSNSNMHRSGLIFFKANNNNYTLKHLQNDAGFSMVEVVAVTLMIGILAMLAIPSWFNFMNRQQVSKANDAVFAAIQEAQRQAIQKKQSYSVSLRKNSTTQSIETAVYRTKKDNNDDLSFGEIITWKTLESDLGVASKKILLGSNMSSNNTAGVSVSYNLTTPTKITFDYMGTLTNPNFGTATPPSTEPPGLKIVVAASNNTIKRCVIVKTILGSTLRGRDSECN